MAKAKEPATETLVETVQDLDFADNERAPEPRNQTIGRSGETVQDQIEAIRASRAKARALRGQVGKRRVITHYHDAERLMRLGMLAPDEHVDAEEAGLLPKPEDFYDTGIPSGVEGL